MQIERQIVVKLSEEEKNAVKMILNGREREQQLHRDYYCF